MRPRNVTAIERRANDNGVAGLSIHCISLLNHHHHHHYTEQRVPYVEVCNTGRDKARNRIPRRREISKVHLVDVSTRVHLKDCRARHLALVALAQERARGALNVVKIYE